MLAMLTKTPEFHLVKEEADMLADSAATVAQYYDVSGMSQKGMAWYNLAQCLAIVYGPRIVAARNRSNEARAAKRRAPPEDMNSGVSRSAAPANDGMPGPQFVDLGSHFAGADE